MSAEAVHTHEDDRLTVGCDACIRAARIAQETARWADAPTRRVTWHCTYSHPVDGVSTNLSFVLCVKVPDDATSDELDERYADATGEAFVMALPETVPMEMTAWACESMAVERVTVGVIVDVNPPAPEPGLFDL